MGDRNKSSSSSSSGLKAVLTAVGIGVGAIAAIGTALYAYNSAQESEENARAQACRPQNQVHQRVPPDYKDKNKDDKKCSICMDDIALKHEAVYLPCGHEFHIECILILLENNRRCPNCRNPITDEEFKAYMKLRS